MYQACAVGRDLEGRAFREERLRELTAQRGRGVNRVLGYGERVDQRGDAEAQLLCVGLRMALSRGADSCRWAHFLPP